MGISRSKLEEEILKLKGGVFFLSPRERRFLDMISEMGVTNGVILLGIKECLRTLEPKRRSKYPIYMCYKKIMEIHDQQIRREAQIQPHWEARFKEKVALVKELVSDPLPKPRTPEEAEEILRGIEKEILRLAWKRLTAQEKKAIKDKFKEYEENRDLYAELIKEELRRRFGIPHLSIYRG